METKKVCTILLVVALFVVLLVVKTVLPNARASKPSLLGYKSACSFAPISTLILCWIAATLFTVRARLMHPGQVRYTLLIVLSVLFLSGILLFSYRYVSARFGSSRTTNEPRAPSVLTVPLAGGAEADRPVKAAARDGTSTPRD